MIDEDAGKLGSQGFSEESGADGAIDAAGEREEYLPLADFFSHCGDSGNLIIGHRPIALSVADFEEEVTDHLQTIFGMIHFRVELHAKEPAPHVSDCDIRASDRVCGQGEAIRYDFHIIAVAHPADAGIGQVFKQRAAGIIEGLCFSIFSRGILLSRYDFTAEGIGHKLASVADSEDRDSEPKDLLVNMGSGLKVNGIRAAGKDKADRVFIFKDRERGREGENFAVDAALTDSARDQLVILSAEVEDDNGLMVQG